MFNGSAARTFFQFVQVLALINNFISLSSVMHVVDASSHYDCIKSISTPFCAMSLLKTSLF